MSEDFERGHHRPHNCRACGSSNIQVDKQGDTIVITCKDCGNVVTLPLPPKPPHKPE